MIHAFLVARHTDHAVVALDAERRDGHGLGGGGVAPREPGLDGLRDGRGDG